MKRTERRDINDLPYSLHDMRTEQMEACGSSLRVTMKTGLVRVGAPCVQTEGMLEFEGVEWDFSYVYILDFCGNTGAFTGRKLMLAAFAEQLQNGSFEIVDETYGYHQSCLSGYLSEGENMKECRVEIYHTGGMFYLTEE